MPKTSPRLLTAALLGLALARCGDSGSDSDDCDPGSQGCACLMDACFTGLQCQAGTCTPLAGTSTTQDDDWADSGDPPTTGMTAAVSDGTTASETTGPSSQVCGDGRVDPGEDCDDANTVEDDACAATCTWNTPRIEFVDEMLMPEQGTLEGEPYIDRCDGVVSSGLGFLDLEPPQLFAVSATCKRPKLVAAGEGYALKFDDAPDLPWYGDMSSGAVGASPCGPASVSTGYQVLMDGNRVRGIWLLCAPVALEGEALMFGPAAVVQAAGTGSMTSQSFCPEGWIVTGQYGHADFRVNSLGAICARPVLTF